ncbi:PadR family transcriptional regulator [Brucella pituitosa]|uniref:PadR family transcriptional regulator n=1 Tax=Brucella pituitosa TaxID=571256 RepID=UPI0009A21D15|nr:PadR family transcriptional regulator [Brucella pituitosa]
MAGNRTNPSFMNGVPELLILKLLSGREMYGYEVVQAIRLHTAEAIALGEGVVYPVLHGLEREGALQSRRINVAGRNRIYYSLTRTGEARFTELASNWSTLATTIQTVIFGNQALGSV